jgi:RNA polymerase sigma-70 factor (ECF subfamily)
MTASITSPFGQRLPGSPAAIANAQDLELLRAFGRFGDADAFAQIVQKYAGLVYATCLRVLGNSARAEDVSQETFFRLMRRPHEVNQNLGAWLHRTATHVALDTLRSENSRRKREIVYTTECDHEASTWSELSPAVDQVLTEMPEELRMLLVRHFLLGISQAQLAEESLQSPATISRRMKQALEDLRQRLRLKGLYAVPAGIVALLCHITARQAPASLVRELGKMAMLSGPAAPTHASAGTRPQTFQGAQASRIAHGNRITLLIHPHLLLAGIGMVGVLIIMQFVTGVWSIHLPKAPTPLVRPEPEMRTGVHADRAAMSIPGSGSASPTMANTGLSKTFH